MLTQDEQERERYESRLKAQRDQYSFTKYAREEAHKKGLAEGLQQGLQQGLAEGLQQGVEKGELVGRIHAFQRLLKLPLTPRQALLDLPLVELHAQAEAMEQQLGALGS